MDKITQLWIRACKSRYAKTRLQSVYRRYYGYNTCDDNDLALILEDIVEKLNLMKVSQLSKALRPSLLHQGEEIEYGTQLLNAYTSAIRLSHVDKLPGLTPPRMYRNS